MQTNDRTLSDNSALPLICVLHESQIDIVRKNYEKFPLCLSMFGCAYANIWILWNAKDIVRLTDLARIEKELQDCEVLHVFVHALVLIFERSQ